MKLATLKDLYIEELRDLYSAENQILKALPKMATAASCEKLKAAFTTHLAETEGQVVRLDQIFEALGEKPAGKTCKAMQGIVAEGEEFISEKPAPLILDAGLVSTAQRVEHYEMAGYGCVRAYAETLGETDAIALLQATLDEEKAADKKLSELAESEINVKAAAGA